MPRSTMHCQRPYRRAAIAAAALAAMLPAYAAPAQEWLGSFGADDASYGSLARPPVATSQWRTTVLVAPRPAPPPAGATSWAATVTYLRPEPQVPRLVSAALPRHAGKSREPVTGRGHVLEGVASYYWQEQTTASGERFDRAGLTAAHKTLPIGTRVKVTNVVNGRSVIVRINDRGPFAPGRVIDLSEAAARAIDMERAGLVPVRMELVGRF